MRQLTTILAAAVLFATSCTDNVPNGNDGIAAYEPKEGEKSGVFELKDIRERLDPENGNIITITGLPEGGTQEVYFEMDDVNHSGNTYEELNKAFGKKVQIVYTQSQKTVSREMLVEGESVMGEEIPIEPDYSIAVGTLSAEGVGAGKFMITTPAGEEMEFEGVVTEDIAAANGKMAEFYYEEMPLNVVRHIVILNP